MPYKNKEDYNKHCRKYYHEKICPNPYEPKPCKRCGEMFKPKSSHRFYCDTCKPIMHKIACRLALSHEKAKRRGLGFIPLNKLFIGCEAHHVDKKRVIYIPKELHKSVKHNIWTGRNMEKINALAFNYLFKQEVAQWE